MKLGAAVGPEKIPSLLCLLSIWNDCIAGRCDSCDDLALAFLKVWMSCSPRLPQIFAPEDACFSSLCNLTAGLGVISCSSCRSSRSRICELNDESVWRSLVAEIS